MKKFFGVGVIMILAFGVSYGNLVIEDCNSGLYSAYYNMIGGCNTCGYFTGDNHHYKGYYLDYWDYFINNPGKNFVISTKNSYAKIYPIGVSNIVYDNYNYMDGSNSFKTNASANFIPSNKGLGSNKDIVVFWLQNVSWLGSAVSRNIPVGIIEYNLKYAELTGLGNIPLSFTEKWLQPGFNGGNFSPSWYVGNTKSGYINSSLIFNHKECYAILPAWCGDGIIDSYAESCDNGNDNWDGNGDPVVKNGIVCNTSCNIVTPKCGPAAKNYSYNDTNFVGDFCSFPAKLVGQAPSFPAEGDAVTWTCSLGNQTITCAAVRGTSNGGGGGGGGGGGDGGGDGGGGGGGGGGGDGGICGNGIIEGTEQCDDGNNVDGDGCSSTCQLESCAVAGTCSVGTCGPLNGQIIDARDTSTLMKFKDPASYHSDFCSNGSILSYSYNPNILNKSFTWYCGTTQCSAEISFNKGVIKIYGSYSGATWACSECNGFDVETWGNIKRKFLSDYDTEYTRSIMSGDYLPFGWILPDYNVKYVSYCNSSSVGKYNKNSVKVRFKAFNRNGDLVYQTAEYNGFSPAFSLAAFPDNSVLGQAYIPANVTKKFSYGENTIKGYITYRQRCQSYQVREIVGVNSDGTPIYGYVTKYKWTNDISSPIEFASQKFTLTNHYMLQLGTTLTNVSNVDLYFNGKSLYNWGINSVSSPYGAYDTGELSKILGDFIQRYKKFAVGNYYLLGDTTTSFKKVLTEEVYYKDLQGGNWLIPADAMFSVPTTILIENGNVIIDGEINGSLMIVVKNGKIKIQNSKMNIQTNLDGYYITDKGFEVTGPAISAGNMLNTNPNVDRWYADGRLKIKGVLIGPDAEKIYKRRRSVLKNWFRGGFGPSWAIEHGASLTITSNPNLWLNAPVGSKDLFEMLKIRKGY